MAALKLVVSDDDGGDDETSTEVERRLGIPHVDGIDQVPRRLHAEDEIELRWFLDDPRLGGIRGTSDFGAQLARAESFGFGALPCRTCGGKWKRKNGPSGEEVTAWRDGTGRRPNKRFGTQETYAVALARYRTEQMRQGLQVTPGGPRLQVVTVSRHHADPTIRAAEAEAFAALGQIALTHEETREFWPTLPDEQTSTCPSCKGIGVVPRRAPTHAEVTAWPTGSSKQPGAREAVGADQLVARAALSGRDVWDGYSGVSLRDLERYVDVDMCLRDTASTSPLARYVLEEYYGPPVLRRNSAERFRTVREVGFEALWPLTKVGTTARTTADKSKRASEVAALYAHACGVYNLCAYGMG